MKVDTVVENGDTTALVVVKNGKVGCEKKDLIFSSEISVTKKMRQS